MGQSKARCPAIFIVLHQKHRKVRLVCCLISSKAEVDLLFVISSKARKALDGEGMVLTRDDFGNIRSDRG